MVQKRPFVYLSKKKKKHWEEAERSNRRTVVMKHKEEVLQTADCENFVNTLISRNSVLLRVT